MDSSFPEFPRGLRRDILGTRSNEFGREKVTTGGEGSQAADTRAQERKSRASDRDSVAEAGCKRQQLVI